VAVQVNTLGAQRCAQLAQSFSRAQLLMHVSTAFTNGTRRGPTYERPFTLHDGMNVKRELTTSSGRLDVPREIATALAIPGKTERRLRELGWTDEVEIANEVTEAARQVGMGTAQRYGWQDTYVFTKAMGEMLVVDALRQSPHEKEEDHQVGF
jgi:alcohol-forming fatty acyl-CoA reductase